MIFFYSIFGVKHAKIEIERGIEIKMKCTWLQTGLLDLENTEHLKFSLMVYKILRIFKSIAFFKFFRDFRNS